MTMTEKLTWLTLKIYKIERCCRLPKESERMLRMMSRRSLRLRCCLNCSGMVWRCLKTLKLWSKRNRRNSRRRKMKNRRRSKLRRMSKKYRSNKLKLSHKKRRLSRLTRWKEKTIFMKTQNLSYRKNNLKLYQKKIYQTNKTMSQG